MKPIDLASIPHKYCLYRAVEAPGTKDPWYLELRGESKVGPNGEELVQHIYPYSSSCLAAYAVGSRTLKSLRKYGEQIQKGSGRTQDGKAFAEGTIIFSLEHLEDVAKILKIRKVRVLTAERKSQLREHWRDYWKSKR